MKKSIVFLSLSILAYNSYSQNELLFKLQYKPETIYSQTVEQSTTSVMKYKASKEILKTLKEKGIENPTVSTKKSVTRSVIKTGKAVNGHFPLTMEFIETKDSDGKKDLPDGTVVYGEGTLEGLPRMDSIASKELSDEFKKAFIQTLQSTFAQLSFPEKKMKTGQSFSMDTPLSLPVAGLNLEMAITTTYKLVSITNGLANFDITQVFTMKTTISDQNVSATGGGKGKMVFDPATNFFSKYNMNVNIEMKLKLESFSLELKTQNEYSQTAEVSKNENAK